MADGRRPPDWRDRFRGGRPARQAHRHPVYGGQARRDRQTGPYIIGFVVVVVAIAVVAPVPSPSPSPVEQTYIVQAGDNPASIAQKFRVKTEDLMAVNNIDDPGKLQIGQTLKIPSTSGPATKP